MLAYRSATHEATGVSPNEMVFGRSATLPVDLVLGRPDPEKCEQILSSEYAKNLPNKLDKIHEFARGKLKISFNNMARDYNAKIQQNSIQTWGCCMDLFPKSKYGT